MTVNFEKLQDKDFLLAFAPEFLNETLQEPLLKKYKDLIEKETFKELPSSFSKSLGKFQLLLQTYYLHDEDRLKLHDLLEEDEVRKTREIKRIEQVGRWEVLADFRRRLTIVFIVVAVIFGIVYYFSPEEKPSFDALSVLTFEALAMEEDPKGRIDFPSNDRNEILSYINADKSLNFKPHMFKRVPPGWNINGASIIDYELAKIVAVQFETANADEGTKEKAFYFVFKGQLSDFPKSEAGNYQGLIYQTYASDQINIIIWKHDDSTIGMLIGRRSAPELASMAKIGM